jgi:hypothetical protein
VWRNVCSRVMSILLMPSITSVLLHHAIAKEARTTPRFVAEQGEGISWATGRKRWCRWAVALCCLHKDVVLRQNMTVVSVMLDDNMEVGKPHAKLLQYLRKYRHELVDLRPAAAGWMDQGKAKGSVGINNSRSPPPCMSMQQLSSPQMTRLSISHRTNQIDQRCSFFLEPR